MLLPHPPGEVDGCWDVRGHVRIYDVTGKIGKADIEMRFEEYVNLPNLRFNHIFGFLSLRFALNYSCAAVRWS